ncbi:D-inositol-3-phosphate glycosyltransferase [compost metagenome]
MDKSNFSNPEAVTRRFNDKSDGKLNILFPSRLVADKGVLVVLAAIEQLKPHDVNINITIMGSGDLEENCRRFASERHGEVTVKYQDNVNYGEEFFKVVSHHDWVLVPTLKQEQPRIIFDAFSQGTPVIASDTYGILDITDKDTALIFETGNPSSLAEAILHAARHPELALKMGLAGLEYAAGKTHLQMHQDREQFLKSSLK